MVKRRVGNPDLTLANASGLKLSTISPTPSVCLAVRLPSILPTSDHLGAAEPIFARRFSCRRYASVREPSKTRPRRRPKAVAAREKPEKPPRAGASASADRALLLADAERLEDFDHAGRMRAALCRAPDRHLQGRAVHAAVSGDLAEQSHAGDRRSGRARADGRSRCSSPAPSCNISAARPANSIRATSAARVAVEEWLFWQMGGLGPMAGQAKHFRRYAPEQIAYAIARYTDEVNRLYGVMNKRLAEREFLAGRYSIADMACVGWVRLAERRARTSRSFRTSSAGSKPSGRGRRSSAPSPSASRRPPRSTCTIRKCARCCSASAHVASARRRQLRAGPNRVVAR